MPWSYNLEEVKFHPYSVIVILYSCLWMTCLVLFCHFCSHVDFRYENEAKQFVSQHSAVYSYFWIVFAA
jgi:hypothetical protein